MTAKYPTLPQRLLDAVERNPAPRAQMHRVNGQWEGIAATEMLRRIASLATALAELGVKPGDRVVIFAPNSPEWHVADFAILGLGAVSVPIYFRESPTPAPNCCSCRAMNSALESRRCVPG